MIITLHQSLSFDTITKSHAGRAAAEAHMVKVLCEDGDWPFSDAVTAAAKGSPVLVRDNGDDETIEIRELKP